ncbi:MAG: hypothetical protein JST00_24935 [Deltaproteobacteria bacterium]|nr:hypothetical protein [Deltaproteobacteria bacterium]
MRRFPALLVAALAACGSDMGDPPGGGAAPVGPPITSPPEAPAGVVLQLGKDVLPEVGARIEAHLASRASVSRLPPDADAGSLPPGSRVVAIGDTATSRALGVSAAPSPTREGFVLRAGSIGATRALVAKGESARANGYAGYAALEELGFGFLHPLAPSPPTAPLDLPASLDRTSAPRWRIRGLQLHTMHPLELTNLLQGWGEKGPSDEAGFRAMLPEWDRFLEWMLANGQNRVHWVLLEAASWSSFAESETRRTRLAELVAHVHAFGLEAGIDVPLVLQQQHTYRLIKPNGDLADETAQLRRRVDWLAAAGFDYFVTSSGTTELTHPTPQRMLDWMNALTRYARDAKKIPTFMTLHCSTGQKAEGFIDEKTGEPINFNYLPHFADASLGVMPHTVQHYGLDDPAPTYGNADFGYVRDFIRREVGRREVVWHPETAYWVSFDVDVPLFLPIYAERRVHDLRLLAADEEAGRMGEGVHAGKRMDGQYVFSSGWEWSYWLNDVVAARAAWDPHLEAKTDDDALRAILDDALRPFGRAREAVRELLVETAKAEHDLLVLGRKTPGSPAPAGSAITKRNGQAYLQGFETWDDVSDLGARLPGIEAAQMTQPARVGLVELRSPVRAGPRYTGEVEPLLGAMVDRFAVLRAKWEALAPDIPPAARDLHDDLVDAMRMTSLRATQVHGLYDFVDARADADPTFRKARLATARTALDTAAKIVVGREPRYRVPKDRIAAWGPNPTAYGFGYLWTVRSLYYFWRDEGLAVDAPLTPCYLNVLSMADVGLGESAVTSGAALLRTLLENPASGGSAECLAAPSREPTFPQYGLRTRP